MTTIRIHCKRIHLLDQYLSYRALIHVLNESCNYDFEVKQRKIIWIDEEMALRFSIQEIIQKLTLAKRNGVYLILLSTGNMDEEKVYHLQFHVIERGLRMVTINSNEEVAEFVYQFATMTLSSYPCTQDGIVLDKQMVEFCSALGQGDKFQTIKGIQSMRCKWRRLTFIPIYLNDFNKLTLMDYKAIQSLSQINSSQQHISGVGKEYLQKLQHCCNEKI